MEDLELGYRDDQEAATFSIFLGRGADSGFIGLILRDAPLVELDGALQPGVRMTPDQARLVAEELRIKADAAELRKNVGGT